MTYQLVLQTISTLTGLAGFVYIAFVASRVHGAVHEVKQSVAEQTTDLKQSIQEQTNALKKT